MATQVSILHNTITATREQTKSLTRIIALDALRGIALILMALDHASFFVGAGLQAESYGSLPVTLQNWPYWISGLLTNLASPIFWLLSGISLALFEHGQRKKQATEWSITRFILIRAGIIFLLDITICNFFWLGQERYVHVLTSMAISMVILSAVRWMPTHVILGLTLTILLGYQAIISILTPQLVAQEPQSLLQALWLTYSYDTIISIGFPVLGWGVLMWLGFVLGRSQGQYPILQRPLMWIYIGSGLLLVWMILRLNGGYGDLGAYTSDRHWIYFLIMSKAPPSLTYLAFNLSGSAFILAIFQALHIWLTRYPLHWLVLVGQVSLFFYITHIVLYSFIARVIVLLNLPGPRIIWGYLTWFTGMSILLLLSYAYRKLRKRYSQSFLRYL